MQKNVPSGLDLIHQTLSNCTFLASLFHWKIDAEDFRKFPSFLISSWSFPHKTQPMCVIQAGAAPESPAWPLHPPLRGLLWLSAHCHFPASLSWSAAAASRAANMHAQIFFFLFQSLHFNYSSSISKGSMFWDTKMFPQVMLLSLPFRHLKEDWKEVWLADLYKSFATCTIPWFYEVCMFVMYNYYMFLFTSGYEKQRWRGEDHQLGKTET